jgi:hypothetical protein
VEIASVKVLRQSDKVSEGFLIEIQRSIVEHDLGGGALAKDAGPELSDCSASQSLFPSLAFWFRLRTN